MRSPGSGGKCVNDCRDFSNAQGLRDLIAFSKRQSAGSKDGSPAAFSRRNRLAAIPWLVGAGLSARMRQLNARHRTLPGDKRKHAPEGLNVRVCPEPKVPRADAALRR